MRLTTKQKSQILEQIKLGYSLNKIANSLDIPKSTTYYHFLKIKGRTYLNPQKYKILFCEKEGEIVGIFAGDGSQYYYKPRGGYQTTVHFGDNMPYVNYVKSLYDNYFGRNWPIHKEIGTNGNPKYRIRTVNKAIFDHFSNYLIFQREIKHCTVKLKRKKYPKSFKIGFLRGLLDTDGTICMGKDKRRRISYYTTSEDLAKQVNVFLKYVKIKSYLYKVNREKYKWKDLYIIQIAQEDIDKFLKVIKPYKIRRLVGA